VADPMRGMSEDSAPPLEPAEGSSQSPAREGPPGSREARPRSRVLRRSALAALGLVAAVVAYALWGFISVWAGSRANEARRVDAIVVLGAAQYHGRPSPVFERRLLRAHELYEQGHARVIVTTGSKQAGDRVTEGYAGFHYLRRRGVPEERLLVVVHGADTWEELTATAHVLSQRQMSRVLLVSDPYHSYRAKRSAAEAGLEAYVSPTDGTAPFGRLARETAAVCLGQLIGFRRVSQLR